MSDGQIVIDIDADADGYERALAAIKSDTRTLGKSLSGSLKSAGDAVANVGKGLTVGITVPLAAGSAAAGRFALDAIASAEQADIAFTTMLGPELAKDMLADLADFATSTPFELRGLQSSTQKLIAMGFAAEDCIPMLTSIGDAASGLGAGQEGIDTITRALGQMNAKGKVQAEEMLQLTEAGIPAWQYLADVISNGDIPAAMEQVTDGTVSADTAIQALKNGMDSDFGGMMAAQSKTLTGIMSNMGDAVYNAVTKAKDTEGYAELTESMAEVADEIGPLVESLMPVLADVMSVAADCLGDAAGGMKWFSSLSEDGRKQVLLMIAAAAGIGPSMIGIGKGAKLVGTFADASKTAVRWLNDFGSRTDKAASASKSYAGEAAKAGAATKQQANAAKASGAAAAQQASATRTASTATKQHSTAVKASSVAMGAAKTAALGVAGVLAGMLVGAIAGVVSENKRYADNAEQVRSANERMKGSLGELSESASSARAAVADYTPSLAEVRKEADDARQAHADLADSLVEINTEAGAEAGALQRYADVVNDLGLKSNLTEQEQARLKDAVDNINEACGTTFQVTDDVNGALYGQVEAINAVCKAKQEQLRYEAASESLKELYKHQEELLIRQVELEQQRSALMEKTGGKNAGAIWDRNEDIEALNETIGALSEVQSELNATGETIEATEQRVGELGAAVGSTSDDLASFVASNESLASVLESTGQSADSFAEALAQCGVSTSDLEGLSEDKLAALAQSYDGSVESIVDTLQEFGVLAKQEGVEAAEEYAEGMRSGADDAVAAAAEVTGRTVDEIRGECDQFGIEGDEAVRAYAEAIASGKSQAEAASIALGKSVTSGIESEAPAASRAMYAMKDGMLHAFDPVTGELTAATADTVQKIAGTIAGSSGDPIEAMAALKDGVVYAYDPVTGELAEITGSAVSGVSSEISGGTSSAATSAANLGSAVISGVDPIKTGLPSAASAGSKGFGSSLADGQSEAKKNAQSMANQSALMNMYSTLYYLWGWEASHNFADGIRSGYSAAVSAAKSIANAVKGILGHSVPKEGPLRNGGKGEAGWGEHAVLNFAEGMTSAAPAAARGAAGAMRAISEAMIAASAATGSAALPAFGFASAYGGQPSDLSPVIEGLDALGRKIDSMADRMEGALAQPVDLDMDDRRFGRLVRKAVSPR